MLARVSVLTLILGTRLGKQERLGKQWKPSNSREYAWLEDADSVTIQEILHERTTVLLGKTPTDKSVCENPDLAQCSVEVDKAAKQRLRVNEEWYRAYTEEELSLRKRRKEIHQTRPWRHWAAKHKGSRMRSGVFLGPKVVCFLGRHMCYFKNEKRPLKGSYERCCLCSPCVHCPSPRKDCAISPTEKPSMSKTLSEVCHTARFLISRHNQMLLRMLNILMQRHVWDLTWGPFQSTCEN